uniref:Uncharacterized protein n=1 Tax=Anopheles culicifacies TaxID=139723 RepID=A0A182MRQ1_9DIPT
MERARQALVRQPYEVSLVAREPYPLVQLVRRHNERRQMVGFLLPQELIQLLGKIHARYDVHVGQEHVAALTSLPGHVAQMVLRVRVLDTPLARVRFAPLEQIVQRRFRFGTVELGEIAYVYTLQMRWSTLLWQYQMKANPLPDRTKAGPSGNRSPTTAKSNTLYSRRVSQRPSRRSSPENTALSVLLARLSASTYSRQVAGVSIGARGTIETPSSAPLLYWLQSPLCSNRTFELILSNRSGGRGHRGVGLLTDKTEVLTDYPAAGTFKSWKPEMVGQDLSRL